MPATRRCTTKPPTADRRSVEERSTGFTRPGAKRSANRAIVDHETVRIMVVDDDPQILKLVAQMIVQLGYLSTTAEDALDALFFLNNRHHDMVITDYEMPFMDGIQLADQIKRRHDSIKVIIMTGQCEATIKDRVKGATSVDGLLFKPFNLNVMRAKIEEVGGFRAKRWIP